MDRIEPSQLRTAARVADALVYAAGAVGVVAGGLLVQSGRLPYALLAWVLTFIAGAVLRLAAEGARAVAELLLRSERIERTLDDLRADRAAATAPGLDAPGGVPDPYRRWGGHH